MSGIVTAIAVALQIINALVGYFKDRQTINAATAEVVQQHLQGAIDEIKKSQAIRDSVRKSFDPDKLPSDDPNLRD